MAFPFIDFLACLGREQKGDAAFSTECSSRELNSHLVQNDIASIRSGDTARHTPLRQQVPARAKILPLHYLSAMGYGPTFTGLTDESAAMHNAAGKTGSWL